MNTTRTKANKVIISLASVLLISCLVSLSVISTSAANYVDGTADYNFVDLPFPHPDTFDGDYVGSYVFYDETNARYEMWAFELTIQGYSGVSSNNYFSSPTITGNSDIAKVTIVNNSNSNGFLIRTYRFWWYPAYTSYSVRTYSNTITSTAGSSYSYTFTGISDTGSIGSGSIRCYGDLQLSTNSAVTSKYVYNYNGDVSPYVVKSMLDETQQIKFYCAEILDALGGGDDYVAPETTTNQTANDYGQAEQELMTNQFQNVEDIANVLPQVDSLQNKSAFQFLSSQIEFLVGAGDYDSTTRPSMDKIYGVVIFVLSIGFVSFAIGLVNRRKE